MKRILNFINGQWVSPDSGEYFDCVNPAKGEVYAEVPDSNWSDIKKAVHAAQEAFPVWSTLPVNARFKIMSRIADLIEENLEELAIAESIDNGKPLKLARSIDMPRAASNFRFFATAILQFASESHAMASMAINYTLRQPIGVVGCISPWNLPLYLFTWKIAPAIAAGNTVVAKPSEITPMTAHLLTEICMEAGLPNGVLNIVHGYGHSAGEAIIKHPEVKAISFTGGTKTGSRIAEIAAPMFKKLSLELGGKNPNIIFADCNYEEMLRTTVRSSFANQGQICLCGSRILVEESIYDQFKIDFVEKTKKLRIEQPMSPNSQIGAVVSFDHMQKILSYIILARDEGGTVLTGGKQVLLEGEYKNGYYLEPTIIEGLDQMCRTNQEEIFGPVVTIQSFKNEEEALKLANSTQYGLSATIWTENLSRAHKMATKIQSGIVWINCWLLRDLRTPFGGVKASGIGREGGFEALKFFTEAKNVCIKYNHEKM
jgi:aminomuconate-semialdehyde/2-hydroxymuconate-6-semialdehyde dehydrogenase